MSLASLVGHKRSRSASASPLSPSKRARTLLLPAEQAQEDPDLVRLQAAYAAVLRGWGDALVSAFLEDHKAHSGTYQDAQGLLRLATAYAAEHLTPVQLTQWHAQVRPDVPMIELRHQRAVQEEREAEEHEPEYLLEPGMSETHQAWGGTMPFSPQRAYASAGASPNADSHYWW